MFVVPLVLIASCAKEERLKPGGPKAYTGGDKAIIIKPSLADEDWTPISRGSSDLAAKEVDSAYLANNGFGLYAYYTGKYDFVSVTDTTVKGLVFNKRKFLYDSGSSSWKNYQFNGSDYSQLGKAEFWPTSSEHNLTFFAFAPWAPWYDGKVTTSSLYDCPYIVYDDYVAQSLTEAELEDQEDLLWGTNTSGMAHKNVHMSSYTPEGVVDMHFRHAPAKVSFSIQGTLAVATVSESVGSVPVLDSELGSAVDSQSGVDVDGPTEKDYVYNSSNRRYYQYEVTEYTIVERQDQDVLMTRTVTLTTSGKRYFIDDITFQGFNKKGTLLLDNASAYEPSWIIGDETLNYSLNSSNVLTTSLQAASAATLKNNLSTYTGISVTPTDMMSGYYLYALPKEITASSPAISVSLTYKTAQVAGSERVTQTGPSNRYRTRIGKRYYVRERYYNFNSGRWSSWSDSGTAAVSGQVEDNKLGWNPSSTGFKYGQGWSDWIYEDVSEWTTTPGSGVPSGTPTAEYIDTKTLAGKIITPFVGGSSYNINLVVTGNILELDVIPAPWELEDEPPFSYDDNINKIIQPLDYDSAFVDYVDGGNVYINNRMGKFYFQMDEGKYVSWKASLEGAPGSFGFTDENGQWIMDGDHRATSVGGAIDPNVMNYIYVKAVDPASPTTNRAKLRIRGTDSFGEDTVLLNLVNNEKVVEWTIVQNAQ